MTSASPLLSREYCEDYYTELSAETLDIEHFFIRYDFF
jgi:hypothetical protein